MKIFLRTLLLILMLLCLLLFVPGATLVAEAETKVYSLTDKVGLKPQADCYLSDTEYADPTISVRIETGRIHDTNYRIAYVKIADASQLRSEMASGYYSEQTLQGTGLAKRVNAVLAINGDYFSYRTEGYTCRQGKTYRTRCDGLMDVMILDENGDMHIIKQATNDQIAAFEGKPINGYTFGPGLIIDGERQTNFLDTGNGPNTNAQRMCLAQTGPLEYMCISSEGPEDPGSVGMTLEQFNDLVSSFDNIQNAYNLDGGSSVTMVFKNKKVNSPDNPKRRPLSDIIYFATAYIPDEAAQ